jgi:hypothetical protein
MRSVNFTIAVLAIINLPPRPARIAGELIFGNQPTNGRKRNSQYTRGCFRIDEQCFCADFDGFGAKLRGNLRGFEREDSLEQLWSRPRTARNL